MTVSSTLVQEFDVDTLCKRAMQLAGLLDATQGTDSPNWTARSSMARDFLEAEIEHWQTLGILQRARDFYALDIDAADGTYTLPSGTLDVFGVAMYKLDGEDTETPVEPQSQDEYQRITDKTTAGRPTSYYAHRGATIAFYLWPVPDAAGTLTLQRHKLLTTAREGSATLDLERHWNEAIMWSLAHKLAVASGLPIDRCRYMQGEAKEAIARAKAVSTTDFADTYLFNAHRTGWR